ncbi:Sucrase/ferredoxin-like-domain-containing protein [Lentinula aciculospora]|uniref:Sucrase/ferredoxin-like-domain-containing protein n=1 Tax=Lentinula aciculospora TaxID=153920 RepID=A0A9W9A1X4_9AGAR|nr:Sucrase/ferredoxin-like-domain-containing protein [Lentinula aciculospora]
MFTLRHLKNSIFGAGLTLEALQAQLDAVAVPFTDVDCRTCPNPCDEGHQSYPNKFSVDMESTMFGSVKPYHRQIVISTGKMDWDREITSTKNSLAAHVQHVLHNAPMSAPLLATEPKSKRAVHVSGVFTSSDSNKLSILNGSHHTISDDPECETVLVFPDYKMVTEVPRSLDGAKALWDAALAPNVSTLPPEDEKSNLNSWIIPFSCVILLCSHKRRDNRCHIAAAQLGQAFEHSLEEHGWTVDTEIEHPVHSVGPPLEELQGTEEENEERIAKQYQELALEKKALILRNSHTGGHRYAGNCIIYTPQGSGVWYGRVSTHEVESIVSQTLEEGLILPPLLRGGMNISRPGCKSLNDW